MPIEASRVAVLNSKSAASSKDFVLYWITASPRVAINHALEYACQRANEHQKPLVACFGLTKTFPRANLRHYTFLLQGLADLRAALSKRSIPLFIGLSDPPDLVKLLAKGAIECVTDKGYLRIHRLWCKQLSDSLPCRFTQIETNVVVPVELASDKEEFAARTIRKKIWTHAPKMIKPLDPIKLDTPGKCDDLVKMAKKLAADVVEINPDDLSFLSTFPIDQSILPVHDAVGGHTAALARLDAFLADGIKHYGDWTVDGRTVQSDLSPYLHYGHICPIEILLKISKTSAPKDKKDSFIEQVLVRRELSMNFVWFNADHYDSLQCLPEWAVKTIREHAKDKREYLYTRDELLNAKTHDKYWNAAQLELVHTGKLTGYMRMYWGKKVIEWTPDMQTAYDWLMEMNDVYELDGRDPNGYTGVAWCFGKHDRAHAERPVFGKLRPIGIGKNGWVKEG